MPAQAVSPVAQHCVWMNAGLLSFRLCNRGFDCENCLLDAAMRGELGRSPDEPIAMRQGCPDGLLPRDRLYSDGHTWLQACPGNAAVWRFGIDCFAAAILGSVTRITADDAGAPLDRGDPACLLDTGIGDVRLAAPVPCRVLRRNPSVAIHPDAVLADYYRDGWIAELDLTDLTALVHLAAPDAARLRLRDDWNRFRQDVALQLLANGGAAGWDAVQHGQPLADVRVLLGSARYLEILRRFVH